MSRAYFAGLAALVAVATPLTAQESDPVARLKALKPAAVRTLVIGYLTPERVSKLREDISQSAELAVTPDPLRVRYAPDTQTLQWDYEAESPSDTQRAEVKKVLTGAVENMFGQAPPDVRLQPEEVAVLLTRFDPKPVPPGSPLPQPPRPVATTPGVVTTPPGTPPGVVTTPAPKNGGGVYGGASSPASPDTKLPSPRAVVSAPVLPISPVEIVPDPIPLVNPSVVPAYWPHWGNGGGGAPSGYVPWPTYLVGQTPIPLPAAGTLAAAQPRVYTVVTRDALVVNRVAGDAPTLARYGREYYHDRRYHQAVENLEAAVALDDRDALSWYFLALARRAAGDETAAAEALRQAAARESVYGLDMARRAQALELVQGPARLYVEELPGGRPDAAAAQAVVNAYREGVARARGALAVGR